MKFELNRTKVVLGAAAILVAISLPRVSGPEGGSDVERTVDRGTWGNAKGIDLFAWVARHEERHRTMNTSMFPSGYVAADDGDGDGLKNSMEPTLVNGWAYVVTDPDTFNDTWNYAGTGPLVDCEHATLTSQEQWSSTQSEEAHGQDWGKPGMQHATDGVHSD